MFDFFWVTAAHRSRVLRRFRLTPNESRGLGSLRPDAGRSMRALAQEWGCDASNATWIVDRLERLGLAERTGAPADRRVRLVVLTERGVRTRAQLYRAMYRPPAELLAHSNAELDALAKALDVLPRVPSKDQAGPAVPARRRPGPNRPDKRAVGRPSRGRGRKPPARR
jgi:DNA-binding MarR family transcriptional regulator